MLRQLMRRTRRDELTRLEAEIAAQRLKIPNPPTPTRGRTLDTVLRDKSAAIAVAAIVGSCAIYGGGFALGGWYEDHRSDSEIRASLEEARAESQAYTAAYNTAHDQELLERGLIQRAADFLDVLKVSAQHPSREPATE